MILTAGGWDVAVALIQVMPAAIGVVVIAGLLWFLAPELRKRVRDADIEVEMPGGAKVKLSEANKNIVNMVTDLQNQFKQLVAEREEQLEEHLKSLDIPFENQKLTPDLIEPEAGQQAEAQQADEVRRELEPEIAPEGGKGAGPGGPAPSAGGKGSMSSEAGPSPTFPGVLAWVDRTPGEHAIERSQLEKAGWTIIQFDSIEAVARFAVSASKGVTAVPRAIVIASSSALPVGLAGLAGMFPDAGVFIYGPTLGNDRFISLGRSRSALLTSSAIGLLSSLTATRCGQCGMLLAEASILPASERKPCPNCGSTRRQFFKDCRVQ